MSAVDTPHGVDKTRPSYHAISKQTVQEGIPKNLPRPVYALDHPETRDDRRDDIIGYQRRDNGFIVITAAANIGRDVQWNNERLPDNLPFFLGQRKAEYSLSRPQETMVLTYWTDGTTIENPRIGLGRVRPILTSHQTLDDKVREDLLELTLSTNTQEAVEYLMVVHNILNTAYLRGKVPLVFRNHRQGHVYHSTTPEGHQELGVGAYGRFSSPLRRADDLGDSAQLWSVEQGATPQEEEVMNKFSAYINKSRLTRARAQLEIAEGMQAALKRTEEYARLPARTRTPTYFRAQGFSPEQAQQLATMNAGDFLKLRVRDLRGEENKAKKGVKFLEHVIEHGRAPTKKELRAA